MLNETFSVIFKHRESRVSDLQEVKWLRRLPSSPTSDFQVPSEYRRRRLEAEEEKHPFPLI